MIRRADMRKGFQRILVFGLTIGVFYFQAPAQKNSSADLNGTYQIDTSRSENVSDIVDSAARNERISSSQKEDLEDKLDAPESISIDIRGQQVTLSSSIASPVTFTADGRTQNAGGARIRADLRGNSLKITSLGAESNYTITLASIDNGRSLRVTRMVTTDYLPQTIYADSYYNKTTSYANTTNSDRNDDYSGSDQGSGDDRYSSSDPKDDGYSTTDPNDYPKNKGNYPKTTTRNGNFYVPGGAVLTGILENRITTEASQNNDRFRLTVETPAEYRGAVIEGYLSDIERAGKVSGSAKLTFNFETIRLNNGQTYDFAGVLQSITDTEGKNISISDEGQVKGKSQTKESIKRGGIGAGLGAIIGGLIGGGKGAIIGATIGGAGGAGSVAVDGKEDLKLEQGAQIAVQSTSPNR